VVSRQTNTQFAVGVHVLTLLAGQPDRPVSSDATTTSVNASPVYVRRVLGQLREAGLVASRSGPHGGWTLTRDAAAITLGDVWRAIQGADPVLALHAAAPDCPVGRSVHSSLADLERRTARAVEVELDSVTLEDVVLDAIAATTQQPDSARPRVASDIQATN
jgi:Rrf2 family protein